MDTDYKSRTRRKNEDQTLQRLGEKLVALLFGQLETMELPDELLKAIEFAPKIRSHGARRRQIQYIGARRSAPLPLIGRRSVRGYCAGKQRRFEILKVKNCIGRSRKFESLEPRENSRLLHIKCRRQ